MHKSRIRVNKDDKLLPMLKLSCPLPVLLLMCCASIIDGGQYIEGVIRAQAKANCLLLGFRRIPVVRWSSVFSPFKCSTRTCELCWRATDEFPNTAECLHRCEGNYMCRNICMSLAESDSQLRNGITLPAVIEQVTSITAPKLYCEIPINHGSNEYHTLYLKWNLISMQNETNQKPVVFVLERRSAQGENWTYIGKTQYSLQPIRVSPNTTYQWRLTAVTPNGTLNEPIQSAWMRTQSAYEPPDPPASIFLESMIPLKKSVTVIVGWEPPSQRTCFYKISWYHEKAQYMRHERIKEPMGTFRYPLRDLEFSTDYTVSITSRNQDWTYESEYTSVTFTTKSCLESYNYSFINCSPPPPSNVTVDVHMGQSGLSATIKWLPPAHTSTINVISIYQVNVSLGLDAFLYNADQDNIHLQSKALMISVTKLKTESRYNVLVTAVTSGGRSKPAKCTFRTPSDYSGTMDLAQTTYHLAIIMGMVILAFTICYFGHSLWKQRMLTIARVRYFEEMERHDALVKDDWSIVSMHEQQEKLGSDSFEIDLDSLILGDVIGQGAFGIVRLAQMVEKKQDEKKTNIRKSVAVKMLKVTATEEDRHQLLQEIEMMKGLGGHPLIVSILAACTRGRTICLVTEHCPGGDLLTYMRKVRDKHHGLYCAPRVDSGMAGGSAGTAVAYADLDVRLSASMSASILECSEASGRRTVTTCNEPDDAIDFPVLVEKDILSYARQIATGMEYLEKNRLIHRDLAARNILLTEDHRQIKISDFGLSRDIYMWNFYQQKTDGKLPVKWMALESLFDHVFTSKSDVWSFGVVLWELVTLGGVPYPGLSNSELLHLLKTGYRMERPGSCSEELYTLIQKCWRTTPASRPSFTELRMHLEDILEASEPYLVLTINPSADYYTIRNKQRPKENAVEDKTCIGESTVLVSTTASHDEGIVCSPAEDDLLDDVFLPDGDVQHVL